jgi:hypothetical protein
MHVKGANSKSDAICEHLGRVAIASRHCVRIDVKRCRRSCVGEPGRDNDNWDTCLEHLSHHEVAEIVQPKVRQTRFATTTDEGLRHPVRKPRRIAIYAMREDESIRVVFVDAFVSRELSQREKARRVASHCRGEGHGQTIDM